MEEKTLRQLVTEICGDARQGEHAVGDEDFVTLMLAVPGGLELLEDVRRIRIAAGFVLVVTREATYRIGLQHVLGVKVRKTGHEAAGF